MAIKMRVVPAVRGRRQNRCGSPIADGLVDTLVVTSGRGCSKGCIANGVDKKICKLV